MELEIVEMLIPASNSYTRPQTKRKPTSITIHETANTNVRANALTHAKLQYNGNNRQASWNLTVDDEKEVYLSVPLDEETYHSGKKEGNLNSISIEICVNRDGDYQKAVGNTIKLVRWLIEKYPTIKEVDVKQHYDWSGKDCPRYLRAGTKGINWLKFIEGVRSGKAEVTKPSKPPKYEQTSGNFKVGEKVTLSNSAKRYATGESIPNKYKGKSYTVQQRGSNRILLKELYSWVKTNDLIDKDGESSKPSKPSKNKHISTNDKVTIDSSASKYSTGESMPSKYKGKTFTVQQVKSNKVLLKELYSWVDKSDLKGQTGTTGSVSSSGGYNIGDNVKIKSSASKYATGETIPSKHKNKSYTIQQVKSDRVLIKELYSWVHKSDILGDTGASESNRDYNAGDKVKIKQSAKKYSTGETIPSRYKNKTYTIQQVKGNKVLLKEILSWIDKRNVY